MTRNTLVEQLYKKISKSSARFLLGICGAPGSGKSTLAEKLLTEWNASFGETAVLLPMDAYHLANEELQTRSLLHLKGIPETFDAKAFVEKLRAVKAEPNRLHFCPRFDRSIEASIENDIKIEPQHKLVITEGNYLLLDSEPWKQIKELLDEVWFIDAAESLLWPRLVARHRAGGKNEKQAEEKVNSTDFPNARLVMATKKNADLVLDASDLMSNA